MKSLVVFLSVLVVALCETPKADWVNCNLEVPGDGLPTNEWIDIKGECVSLARQQIRMEFQAALAYLQLGSYFNQYNVNRPGFASFFFSAASEERSHAIKIFDYLLMRGQMTQFHSDPELHTLLWGTGANKTVLSELNKELTDTSKRIFGWDALNKALALEVSVTRSIKRMIKACENEDNLTQKELDLLEMKGVDADRIAKNDYHMVDWLITDLLDEQLKGQRELAGRISTLYKMKDGYGVMAEFLYDQKLQEEVNSKAA